MIAFDTNVLVYSVDAHEPAKQSLAQSLIDEQLQSGTPVVLPWQVGCELLACLRRWESAGRIGASDVEEFGFRFVNLFPFVMPTADVFAHSFELNRKFSLSHWDSLLVSACLKAGVDTLYSEDLDDGARYDTMTVVNPFS